MKEMSGGPLDAKTLLDEIGAAAVNRLGQFNRFILTLSRLLQPAHPFFERRVNENMEGICRSRKY